MAARTFSSNFGNLFGASQTYKYRGRMMVLVVNLMKVCKNPKWGSSSLCFNVTSCQLCSGQPGQSQHWWSTEKLFTLTWSWMRWQVLTKFGLEIIKTRGAKWVRFYKVAK
jgi:hypothetical protein